MVTVKSLVKGLNTIYDTESEKEVVTSYSVKRGFC